MPHSAAETVLITRQAWELRWAERGGGERGRPLVIFGADRSPICLIQSAARGGALAAVVGVVRDETSVPVTTWTPDQQDNDPPAVRLDACGRGVLAVLVDRNEQVGQGRPGWWTSIQAGPGAGVGQKVVVVVAVGPAVDRNPQWAADGDVLITLGSNRTIHPAWSVGSQNSDSKPSDRIPNLF